MRKSIAVATLLILSLAALSAPAGAAGDRDFQRHFSIKLTGGLGDLGKGDWKKYDWTLPDGNPAGERFKWGWDGGVEIRYHFHPEFSLAAGFDRFWGKMDYTDNLVTGMPGGESDAPMIHSDHGRIESRSLPLTLTLYGNTPTYPLQTYAGVGVGYYFSKVSWYSDTFSIGYQAESASDIRRLAKLDSGAFGYHWVLGLNYFLTRGVALAAELDGRLAKVSGYTGSQETKQRDQETIRSDAELLFYETGYMTDSGEFRTGQLSPDANIIWPSAGASEYSPVRSRDAVMDFSGLSLKLGMTYHF